MGEALQWCLEHVEEIAAAIAILWGLYKHLKEMDLRRQWEEADGLLDKWQLIRQWAPIIHDAVERAAKETPTKKDDLFVEKIAHVLKLFGFELDPDEVKAVKDLGTAVHEAKKAGDTKNS